MGNEPTVSMPKDMFDRWQANLRSGEYLQGRGALCTIGVEPVAYCCLGVLQHGEDGEVEGFIIPDGGEGLWRPHGLLSRDWCRAKGIEFLADPEYTTGAGGYEMDIPILSKGVGVSSLNDGDVRGGVSGLPFVEIADLLLEVVETY